MSFRFCRFLPLCDVYEIHRTFVFFSLGFDFESSLQEVHLKTDSTEYYQKHRPISCAVYSESIYDPAKPKPTQFEPVYLENADSCDDLVTSFLDTLNTYSDWAYELNKTKYASIIRQLNERIDVAALCLAQYQGQEQFASSASSSSSPSSSSEGHVDPMVKRWKDALQRALRLYDEFDNHIRQLLAVGYNSHGYDLQLILGHLTRAMKARGELYVKRRPGRKTVGNVLQKVRQGSTSSAKRMRRTQQFFNSGATAAAAAAAAAAEDDDDDDDDDGRGELDHYRMAIRRGSRFVTFQSNKIRFIDATEYLGSPVSLRKFLQCFRGGDDRVPAAGGGGGQMDEKLFFPYELVVDSASLDRTEFPAYEDFYSSLQEENTLEEGTGDREHGLRNYAAMRRLWDANGMTSLRDWLRLYNCVDVAPMYRAVRRMLDMYHEIGVNAFNYLTLPSLGYDYAMRRCRHKFWTCPPHLEEVVYLTSQSITGGFASPLSQRKCVTGETLISPHKFHDEALLANAFKCLDFNSLYPFTMMGMLPTGSPKVRYGPDFVLETKDRRLANSREGIQYARWLARSRGVHVQHEGCGFECKLGGRYTVDAFIPETGEAVDYHGCAWHAHGDNCPNFTVLDTELCRRQAEEKRTADREKAEFLTSLGYKYSVVWACEFDEMKRSNKALRDFLDGDAAREQHQLEEPLCFPSCFEGHEGNIDLPLILDKVKDGSFYGFLMVRALSDYELKKIITQINIKKIKRILFPFVH